MHFKKRFLNKLKIDNYLPKVRTRRQKIVRKILQIAIYVILGLALLTAVAFAWFAKDLPTPSKIASRKVTESTKIYDRTGQILLYETGDQKRTIVTSDQISKSLKDGTVATEDANFYKNHGFETKAILSAIFGRLTGRTNKLRGGSTITQQYVKNSFLTNDRSYTRKFKELILSIELEFMYSKDQILTMYLNEIPYGNGTAGVEAAANMYYGKHASELDLAQSATLIAIPQSPTYYSPYGVHVQDLIIRRNYVIARMVQTGKISKADGDKAEAEDTTTLGVALKPRSDSFLAPHFAMYVIDQLVSKYGEDTIQKEGLKVISTLDYPKQQAAQTAIDDGSKKLSTYGASNAALVAIDPKTGEVLSMIGSLDYFNTKIDGNVNVTDSLRQPGSSFKPIVYSTAFKQPEYSPSKIIFDLQTDFGGGYVPQNYNLHNYGPVTMRQALDNSLNVPAVKVLSLAGIDNVLHTASDLGITSLTKSADQYGLSLALGTGEVKPVEMADAFSTFANGGVRHDIQPVLKVSDSNGNTLFEYKPEKDAGKQALDPQIAYELSNILSDNNARALVFGTRSSLYFPDRNVGVKTGTTTDFKDAWTIGFTPSISVAVWVGNNNATKMKEGADGSVVAAPIFHEFIQKSLAGTPNETFAVPDGIKEMTVERYSNKLPTASSKDTIKDIFTSWQIPTTQDDVNQNLTVCKSNEADLAPANAPAALVENKLFRIVHSEKPDNQNWEGPVHAWAVANGMADTLPTTTCDLSTNLPTVTISSPKNGDNLSGKSTIIATTSGTNPINSVEFFIDGISIGTAASAPFEKSYDFNNLANGQHKISVVATDSNNITTQAEVSVTSTQNLSGPTISGITTTVTSSTADTKTLQISWQTDVPALGQVTATPTNGQIAQTSPAESALGLTHSISLILPAGTTYNLSITAKDASGNATTATKQTDSL